MFKAGSLFIGLGNTPRINSLSAVRCRAALMAIVGSMCTVLTTDSKFCFMKPSDMPCTLKGGGELNHANATAAVSCESCGLVTTPTTNRIGKVGA